MSWTKEDEESLVDLFDKGASEYEMASALKRTRGGIRARLKKLGLIEVTEKDN